MNAPSAFRVVFSKKTVVPGELIKKLTWCIFSFQMSFLGIKARGYTEPGGATRLAWSLHQLGNQAALVAPPAR